MEGPKKSSIDESAYSLVTVEDTSIFIIGVEHNSEDDSKTIRQVINVVSPSVVGIEMCEERFSNVPRKDIEFESMTKAALYVFGNYLKKISHIIWKNNEGKDTTAAVNAASNLGATVALLDRRYSTTFQRFVEQSSVVEFAKTMLSIGPPKPAVEKERMSPAIRKVFIEERDEVMAQRLRKIARDNKGPIVGVIGESHVPGVVSQLEDHDGQPLQSNSLIYRNV